MSNRKKILVIDDESDLLEIVKARLDASGFETLTAPSGEAGLEMASRQAPDLILLDLMMPEMNGYEVCEVLKRAPQTKEIPVVVLSALADEDSLKKAEKFGADGYLAKPFDSAVLLDTIRKFLK